MSVKLLAEHHLEFLSLKGGCTVSSESTLVKIPHCWKSRVKAQTGLEFRVRNENLIFLFLNQNICCGYLKDPSQ